MGTGIRIITRIGAGISTEIGIRIETGVGTGSSTRIGIGTGIGVGICTGMGISTRIGTGMGTGIRISTRMGIGMPGGIPGIPGIWESREGMWDNPSLSQHSVGKRNPGTEGILAGNCRNLGIPEGDVGQSWPLTALSGQKEPGNCGNSTRELQEFHPGMPHSGLGFQPERFLTLFPHFPQFSHPSAQCHFGFSGISLPCSGQSPIPRIPEHPWVSQTPGMFPIPAPGSGMAPGSAAGESQEVTAEGPGGIRDGSAWNGPWSSRKRAGIGLGV